MYRYQSFRFLALLLLLSGSCLLHATQVVGVPPSNNKAWIHQTESSLKALKGYPEKVEFVRKTFEQVIRHQQVDKLQALLDSEKIVKEIPRIGELGLIFCCDFVKERKAAAAATAAAFRAACGENNETNFIVVLILGYYGDEATYLAPAVDRILKKGAKPFLRCTTHDYCQSLSPLMGAVSSGSEYLVRSFLGGYFQIAQNEETRKAYQEALKATIQENKNIALALPFLEKGIYYPKLLHDIAEYFPLQVLQSFLPTLPYYMQQALLTEKKKERENSVVMQHTAESTLVAYVLKLGYHGQIADFRKKAEYLISFIYTSRLTNRKSLSFSEENEIMTIFTDIEEDDASRENSFLTYALCPIVENGDIEMLSFILSHAGSMIKLNQVYGLWEDNAAEYTSAKYKFGKHWIRCELYKENILLKAVMQNNYEVVRILFNYGADNSMSLLDKESRREIIHRALGQLHSWNTVANQNPINRDLEKLVAGYTREASGLLVRLNCASDIAKFCGQTPFILSVIETLCAHTPAEYLKGFDYYHYVKKLRNKGENDIAERVQEIFKGV